MPITLGPVLPEDYVSVIEWIDEKPRFSRTYGERPKPVYFENERRLGILKDPESLPVGIYPLIGMNGRKAIFYSFSCNQGAAIAIDDIKRVRNSGWNTGVPRYLVKK